MTKTYCSAPDRYASYCETERCVYRRYDRLTMSVTLTCLPMYGSTIGMSADISASEKYNKDVCDSVGCFLPGDKLQ